MAALLLRDGFEIALDPEQADVLLVNTCGFIGPAKAESLDVLQEFARKKRKDQLLIAAGCLTQRYGAEIIDQVPEIDGLFGTRRWMDVVQVVQEVRGRTRPEPLYHLPDAATVGRDERGVARVAVQGASAYLKIADGCRRPCAFCAIPRIKGTAVSRPPEMILEEAAALQDHGVRELILIAQDTTDYGHDLGVKDGLALLLKDLVARATDLDWIRVMYAYPGYVTDALIDAMAQHEKIVNYLDIPLQHAHPATLKRMRRPANMQWVHETITNMRRAMPDLAIRTTFIVGYPGETEEEFQTLLDFVEQMRFDRVGTFTFSFEEGTSSEALGDPIPEEVKAERRERLMKLQQSISLEKNQQFIGKTLDVLIEGTGDGISLGRSYRDAPEIDGMVIIEQQAQVGELVPVRITGAMVHDLVGVLKE